MEDEFGDGWNSISEECDCTDCNGTRSTGRCFRSEAAAKKLRSDGAAVDSDSALDYFSAEGGNAEGDAAFDDVRWGNVANWRTLGMRNTIDDQVPHATRAQQALEQREREAEQNSLELLKMIEDEKVAATMLKSKKKKKKKKSPSKSKWGPKSSSVKQAGAGASASASASAGAGASASAGAGAGGFGYDEFDDSQDEVDGDSTSLRSVSSAVSISSYSSAAATMVQEKNKELQDRLSSLGQALRDERDLKQQTQKEHSRREERLSEQVAQLQKRLSTLTAEKDASARKASKKLAAVEETAAKAVAASEKAVADAKDAADAAVAEHAFCLGLEDEEKRGAGKKEALLKKAATLAPLGHISWPTWNNDGNPTLLHLSHAVHIALPHLVAGLVRRVGVDNCMLVGACAWMGRTKYPFKTDDMDFSVHGRDVAVGLNEIVSAACTETARVPEVVRALALLEEVSTVYRKRRQQSTGMAFVAPHSSSSAAATTATTAHPHTTPPSNSPSSATSRGVTNAAAASTDAATDASAAAAVTNAAAAHASAKAERAAKALHDSEARELLSQIRAAEAKYRPVSGSSDAVDPLPELTDGDLDRFKDFFRISRNQIGWKVSISHMTLMDVTPAERVLPFDCTLMPVARCLPGAYVYAPSPYALSVQVNVAPVAMLLEKMKESLDSGCSWRFQKDIVRLRAVSHALWMQLHTLAYSSDPKGGGGGDDQVINKPKGPSKRVVVHLTTLLDRLKELLRVHDPQWESMLNVLDLALPLPVAADMDLHSSSRQRDC